VMNIFNRYRPGVRWPKACEKTAWDTVKTVLCFALERFTGSVEKKLDKFGDIIYAYGRKEKYKLLECLESSRKLKG